MKKILSSIILAIFLCGFVFSESTEPTEISESSESFESSKNEGKFVSQKSDNLSFSIGIDFAYYPKSEHKEGGTFDSNETSFSPITEFYSALEARINLEGTYKIPTPLGNHWLLKNANVKINEKLEISPVSIMPITQISFTPLPFLVFDAGFQLGTGWNLGNIIKNGMSIYSPKENDTNNYEPLTPFSNLYTKYWIQGTFQFDFGAIFKGDWTHVQILYSYRTFYEGLTGVEDKSVWAWQCTVNKANGLKEYQQTVLAYSMPFALRRVGILFESERFYNDDAFENEKYVASFADLDLSPMAQFEFSEKDSLIVVLNFRGRRKFVSYKDDVPESFLEKSGREWFFRRVGLKFVHKF